MRGNTRQTPVTIGPPPTLLVPDSSQLLHLVYNSSLELNLSSNLRYIYIHLPGFVRENNNNKINSLRLFAFKLILIIKTWGITILNEYYTAGYQKQKSIYHNVENPFTYIYKKEL